MFPGSDPIGHDLQADVFGGGVEEFGGGDGCGAGVAAIFAHPGDNVGGDDGDYKKADAGDDDLLTDDGEIDDGVPGTHEQAKHPAGKGDEGVGFGFEGRFLSLLEGKLFFDEIVDEGETVILGHGSSSKKENASGLVALAGDVI